MDTNPLVSIIVPCYNQAQFLPEALDSIFAQTYKEWECIIINDGSPDNTEEVALDYCSRDKRFVYICQENQGVVVARNNAIHASKGEYIISVDSDDWIEPDCLEMCLLEIRKSHDIKLVYFDAELFGKKNGLFKLADYSLGRMLVSNCIPVFAMFKRSDYDKTSGYNENMKNGLEDWDFWLSMLEQGGEVVKINKVFYHYRIKDVSRNNSFDEYELRALILSNHAKLFSEKYKELWYAYHSLLSSRTYKLALFIQRVVLKMKIAFVGIFKS
ncbi:MAG: glycosyltransferase family 2 protein [Prevotella sp.]|nr:glycosyltransferase family 2 protein [Prevotella sp.]